MKKLNLFTAACHGFLFICLIGGVFSSAFSWNMAGHQVIASIAYQNLNPGVKNAIDNLTPVMFRSNSGYVRFLLASGWPDYIKGHHIHAFDSWHFIDYPYSMDNTPSKPVPKENVVWAILQSIEVMKSSKATQLEKAWFFNFLSHFVGDIHQPLHCTTLYSKQFPDGDRGGNLFSIQSNVANNLHAYWDAGAGLLKPHLRFSAIQKLADQISTEYPKSFFSSQIENLQPATWAYESYKLAKQQVYSLQPNTTISANYTNASEILVKKQLALAGYRLANLLNTICGNNGEYCEADK